MGRLPSGVMGVGVSVRETAPRARSELTIGCADVHAFLAWFDILFECTHTKVKFSTGPHAKYTHWK